MGRPEEHGGAFTDPFGGTEHGAPATAGHLLKEQDLDGSPGLGLVASEAGRDDLGIIKDEEVAGTEPCAEVIESGFVPRRGGALDNQETGVVALRRRMLGHEFLGEVEVEVSDSHGGSWGGKWVWKRSGRGKRGRCNRGGEAVEFRVKSLGMS